MTSTLEISDNTTGVVTLHMSAPNRKTVRLVLHACKDAIRAKIAAHGNDQ